MYLGETYGDAPAGVPASANRSLEWMTPNRGVPGLTEREAQVMDLAALGMSDRQIGLELGISRDTVASYWRRILLKFGSSKRTEVVARFAEHLAAKTVADVQQSNLELKEEISKQRSVELADAPRRALLNASAVASSSFIDGQIELFDILARLLKDVISASGATFGFFAETSIESSTGPLNILGITDLAWDSATSEGYFQRLSSGWQTEDLPEAFRTVLDGKKKMGIERRMVSVPTGEEVLRGPFVIFPIRNKNEVIGLLALACPIESVDQGLSDAMESVLQLCGKMIAARRSDL